MKNKRCPKCLGAKEIMQPKANGKKGFEYQDCTLCKAEGVVTSELESDYLFSMNEDDFEFENEL
jgi:glutaredoxin